MVLKLPFSFVFIWMSYVIAIVLQSFILKVIFSVTSCFITKPNQIETNSVSHPVHDYRRFSPADMWQVSRETCACTWSAHVSNMSPDGALVDVFRLSVGVMSWRWQWPILNTCDGGPRQTFWWQWLWNIEIR